ncbi:DUF3095 domain-containing protein [Hongsoonwoonella zoysiae]|uniref:DUF3095 domain-containing protein n=1 Tax=Hongsoonwoonella zoysiae TaxID=2821844 RepID=UPI001AEE8943|nr:DUF3095 domain-containing protein [Hongsoonwoonella zoysiae]
MLMMTDTASDRYYADLPVFDDFARIGEGDMYSPVPGDWHLMASDIVRSGDAIAQGRYKDVNLVGAACITAILNAADGLELPFVFGGDGAIVAVPASRLEEASKALAGVRKMARDTMGFSLRIAAIPVSALRKRGVDLRIRKFELSPGNHLAMFTGGGLEMAEKLLKDDDDCRPFRLPDDFETQAILDGLSCRWEPLPAKNGQIASLMVRPKTAAEGGAGVDIVTLLGELGGILGTSLVETGCHSRPVREETLNFRFPPTGLEREVQLAGKSGRFKAYARILFECVAFLFAYRTGWRVGPLRPKRYVGELQTNTDFRKFDDTLRLVLDLTPEQVSALSAYLNRAHLAGRLVYGLHITDSALMTCLIFDLEQSRHVHFVDGGDGGLTQAARDFKTRLHPGEAAAIA